MIDFITLWYKLTGQPEPILYMCAVLHLYHCHRMFNLCLDQLIHIYVLIISVTHMGHGCLVLFSLHFGAGTMEDKCQVGQAGVIIPRVIIHVWLYIRE